MPSDFPFLPERAAKLPKWAQKLLSDLRVEEINNDMANCLNADVRRTAKQILGGNLTFSDDDLRLLATLAVAAIDADLHFQLGNPALIANIEKARKARALDMANV